MVRTGFVPQIEPLEQRNLLSIPALSSLPSAEATVYLDFDGHFESSWAQYSNISTPVFDLDGDPTSFGDSEVAAITAIWEYVAEDYAPFNINVTTVEPASFANGVALRVAIGGDGAWTGGFYSGMGAPNSFTNAIPNTSFVFSENLSGIAKFIADSVSHESGHSFGLEHQSLYDAGGNKLDEYYKGAGDGRAPLMGNSMAETRGLWWYGTTTSSTTYQDDMAVLASSLNGFGYRPDDHGDDGAAATTLVVAGGELSGAGIISQTSDRDYFAFYTNAGEINLSIQVPDFINNLDAVLELRNGASGDLIATSNPANSFEASITTTVAAGTYYLVVASNGNYGDVGQYTVGGTVIESTRMVRGNIVRFSREASQGEPQPGQAPAQNNFDDGESDPLPAEGLWSLPSLQQLGNDPSSLPEQPIRVVRSSINRSPQTRPIVRDIALLEITYPGMPFLQAGITNREAHPVSAFVDDEFWRSSDLFSD